MTTHRTEELASKAVGGLKSIKASAEGLWGVFRKLSQEHGEAMTLLMRIKVSSDPKTWSELFPVVRGELLAHEKGELREVYTVFRQYDDLEPIALDHDEEAAELEHLLKELTLLPYEDRAWKPIFDRLVERVSHHVKEEENEYFPKANRILGRDQAERIEVRYDAAKVQAKQHAS